MLGGYRSVHKGFSEILSHESMWTTLYSSIKSTAGFELKSPLEERSRTQMKMNQDFFKIYLGLKYVQS